MDDLNSKNELSPTMHDPVTQAAFDYSSRVALEEYFNNGQGSSVEKLENFAKYVPRQNIARFMARYELFKLIQNIQGSVVECGVLFGGGLMSFAKLSTILEPYNFQRKIIGFDTFSGFPSIAEEDILGLPDRKSAHLKESGFSAIGAFEDIQESVRIYDLSRYLNHFQKIHLVKGDFNETSRKFLSDYPHLVVSLLYLDFDIYQPTKTALEQFLPRMPKGAVIAFDELNEEAFPGETVAVMEMLDLNSIRIRRFEFEPRISYAIIGD